MKGALLSATFLALWAAPAPAAEQCHLNTPAAIFCGYAQPAAAFFVRYGKDSAVVGQSNIQAILHQFGCRASWAKNYATVKVIETQSGKVPLETGWVSVKGVMIDGWIGFMASDYITGACEKYSAD